VACKLRVEEPEVVCHVLNKGGRLQCGDPPVEAEDFLMGPQGSIVAARVKMMVIEKV